MNSGNAYPFSRGAFTYRIVILILFLCFQLINSHESHAFERVKFIGVISSGLSSPVDVALSQSGDLFVLDKEKGRVLVYETGGRLIKEFGSRGSKPGEFSSPKSIYVTNKGKVIVADTGNDRIEVFNTSGKFLYYFGKYGSDPGKFDGPTGVAVDRFGLIFVADRGNSRVQVFTPRGVFLYGISTEGSPRDIDIDVQRNLYVLIPAKRQIVQYSALGDLKAKITCRINGRDYLEDARGISVDGKGDIFFTDSDYQSIKKVNVKSRVLATFGSEGDGRGQFKTPTGLASSPEGKIMVADTGNKRIQILNVLGKMEPMLSPELSSPPTVDFESSVQLEKGIVDLSYRIGAGIYALSEEANHIVLKGSSNKVLGEPRGAPGSFDDPEAMYISKDGKIYVADTGNHRLQIMNADGSPDYYFGVRGDKTGQFNKPSGVVLNSKGTIYVADTRNHRVQMFSNDGIFLSSFGRKSKGKKEEELEDGTFRYPSAVAVDSKDHLFVLDSGNNRIQVFDENGKFLWAIGKKGKRAGQFEDPVDIAIDENDLLYVAERGNSRVQIFKPSGLYVLSFGAPGEFPGYFKELSSVTAKKNRIYIADRKKDAIQVFNFYPSGKARGEPILVTKTGYPPYGFKGTDEEKKRVTREAAINRAVKELVMKTGMAEDEVRKSLMVESEEYLRGGKLKLTISIPKIKREKVKTKATVEKKGKGTRYELK